MKLATIKRGIVPLIIILLFLYVFLGNVGKMVVLINVEGTSTVGEILDSNEISQTFIAPMNNLSGFSVKFGTYARNNSGDITIGIRRNAGGSSIYETTVQASSIADNQYYDFKFPPLKYSKGNSYLIYINSNGGQPGSSLTAYISEEDIYSSGDLFVNGVKRQGELTFKVIFNKTIF
jgi:hypothetical protein